MPKTMSHPADATGVDLYWLPLGAGGHVVRLNGRMYEIVAAWRAGRPARDPHHSPLVVTTPEGRFVIESAPIRTADGADRGVVGEGPVGSRALGRLRIFRYELRCWRDGTLPDIAEAVDSPRRLTTDVNRARQVVDLVRAAPLPVWGRDELRTGDMWNSNSFIAWLIECAGLDAAAIEPPSAGRAPGWQAGVVVAARRGRRKPPPASLASDRLGSIVAG